MDIQSTPALRRTKVWLTSDAGRLEDFQRDIDRQTRLADWPFAEGVEKNVLIYNGRSLRRHAQELDSRRSLTAELCEALAHGPGVFVIKNAMPDLGVVDRATELFTSIIEEQIRNSTGGGDHFAKPGTNDRIWNSLEKHGLADPDNFVRYYSSTAITLASEAWLGAGYQMTAQVNRVNPGGAAQTAHRDYHLGFMSCERSQDWPAHMHAISPVLTLQGAIAHSDMPLETGPTLLLPWSQNFLEGYVAFSRPEFQAVFAARHIQLPLAKGDAVFFNPALMHAAGPNRTANVQRLANLLQVSSAFGRAMETVNRHRLVKALYPALLTGKTTGTLGAIEIANAVAASAEGYSFPTNLDRDPPIGGLAPKTQAAIMLEALAAGDSFDAFAKAVDALVGRQES
jgi:ectoine hydroxylase-related dioxygenase (phytanoyl-CoA dioxygenase family)